MFLAGPVFPAVLLIVGHAPRSVEVRDPHLSAGARPLCRGKVEGISVRGLDHQRIGAFDPTVQGQRLAGIQRSRQPQGAVRAQPPVSVEQAGIVVRA